MLNLSTSDSCKKLITKTNKHIVGQSTAAFKFCWDQFTPHKQNKAGLCSYRKDKWKQVHFYILLSNMQYQSKPFLISCKSTLNHKTTMTQSIDPDIYSAYKKIIIIFCINHNLLPPWLLIHRILLL